jgi:hypothetical protein
VKTEEPVYIVVRVAFPAGELANKSADSVGLVSVAHVAAHFALVVGFG